MTPGKVNGFSELQKAVSKNFDFPKFFENFGYEDMIEF